MPLKAAYHLTFHNFDLKVTVKVKPASLDKLGDFDNT